MLLHDIVQTSLALSATRSRTRKAEILGEVLSSAGADVAIAIGLLVGEPRQGRIGIGYAGAFAADAPPSGAARLTLVDVDAAITELSSMSGAGSQAARAAALHGFLSRATGDEQEFLRRVFIGEVRHGALESLVLDGVVKATGVDPELLRRAAMLCGDIAEVAASAFSGGNEALAAIELEVMRPVLPMLAQTAKDVASALVVTGVASVEWKLDGLRIQAHRNGDLVRVFTRARNDITNRLPDVVRVVASMPAASLILDGEAISVAADGRPAPFQETMSRVSAEEPPDDVPVLPFFFDVLHVDGASWIERPLSARLAELDRLVPENHRVPRVVTDDPLRADTFLAEALERGHEGVLVKGLESNYEAGRRGSRWLKVKPAHTLDLVVLAAEWGSGRRTGWLSNLHLGARDPATGGFVMLGKTFKGLTDETLRWQTERLQEIEVRRTRGTVFVEPKLVVEIAFDGILPSPRYPGGMALRFARVKGYRPDKSAEDADTIETVRRIFERP